MLEFTYAFQFCPVNNGEGAMANHQLGGGDDVHHADLHLDLLLNNQLGFRSLADQFSSAHSCLSHWWC